MALSGANLVHVINRILSGKMLSYLLTKRVPAPLYIT